MPKTPSTKLFNLVKSLSGSEKRYFKIFVGKQGQKDNKYLLLFDAIDAQEAFDETALKKEVYGSEEILSRKYSELKSYLYELILKSLQAYDEKSSVAYRLKSMLQSVQALFQRSLFDDCLDHLSKAKKLAGKYEQFTVALEILSWEKKIAYAQSDIDFLDRELGRIDTEEKKILHRLRNISEYRNIFFRLLVNLRKDVSLRGAALKEKLATTISSPLLQDPTLADSHQAKVLYYRILSIYYLSASELSSFYDTSRQLLGLIESKPYFLKEDVSEYISALNNHIISCGKLSKFDELEKTLIQLREVRPISQDDELKIFRQYYQNIFTLHITKGTFDQGMEELMTHLKEKKRFDQSLFDTHSFYYFYFYISFGARHYEKALSYLNIWLGLPNTIERQDLQVVARILNLLVHYELGNFVLLESLIRSTQRFLKKRGKLNEVERKVISFIKKASEALSKRELREEYESLVADFKDLSQQPLTKALFTKFFDLMAWLESKVEGKPFAEVIQRKFSNQFEKNN